MVHEQMVPIAHHGVPHNLDKSSWLMDGTTSCRRVGALHVTFFYQLDPADDEPHPLCIRRVTGPIGLRNPTLSRESQLSYLSGETIIITWPKNVNNLQIMFPSESLIS